MAIILQKQFNLLLKKLILLMCIISYLGIIFSSDFSPEDQENLNYRQIFFRWPQISGTAGYQLTIFQDGNPNELLSYSSGANSILIEDFLDWGTSYGWEVCGLDFYSESCFTQNQFSINPLSVFHPNEISILYIDEENYYEGINILDFVFL